LGGIFKRIKENVKIHDQLQRASALNILINAISVWNTVYLIEATDMLKKKAGFREDLLSHISPLG